MIRRFLRVDPGGVEEKGSIEERRGGEGRNRRG
jgi:hypothetical protein